MKKRLITASVFLFGLGLGSASAGTFGTSAPDTGSSGITEEMAKCVYDCELTGTPRQLCWSCCVKNMCDS